MGGGESFSGDTRCSDNCLGGHFLPPRDLFSLSFVSTQKEVKGEFSILSKMEMKVFAFVLPTFFSANVCSASLFTIFLIVVMIGCLSDQQEGWVGGTKLNIYSNSRSLPIT